ncbi:MAG: tRNA (guanine(10)-N(2))-dimethyltransferase [Methanospirillaceae archaeon]|nr:tRNA (guanine(10)-N(2))-dimethyltransferase [Methanospirillaceae archaeon]
MELIPVREGDVQCMVSKTDASLHFPPGSGQVFYNPRMVFNRDMTILMMKALQPGSYLDAMGASGIRGFRVAAECGIPVTINDHNPVAVDLITKNSRLIPGRIEVTCRDANALMHERHFHAVDLDPFGSPVPFLDAGLTSALQYLFVTATDTAPLCGAHKKAGIRRYNAIPGNTEYHSEVGLRILLGCVARKAAQYDLGINPLFCFARQHYVRLHCSIRKGAKRADTTLFNLGFVYHCYSCMYRMEEQGFFPSVPVCPYCGSKLEPIGPLWMGQTNDPLSLAAVREQIKHSALSSPLQTERLIDLLLQELPMASFYDYHHLARKIRISPAPVDSILDALQRRGYLASRVHYTGTGLKTNAPMHEILECIRV